MIMTKLKIVLFGALVILCGQMKSQDSDPVIMNIAGEDVRRSEFEYALNKNSKDGKVLDRKAIEDYVELFIDYRLKVKAALDNKLDTATSFKKEYEYFRDTQLKSYLLDTVYIDSLAHANYVNIKQSVGDSDIIHVAHIMISLPQKADTTALNKAKHKIYSIYRRIQNGESFEDLAKKYSNDTFTASKGGKLPWIGPHSALPDFTAKVYSMPVGVVSEPFRTTAGYHVAKVLERKQLESYEERKPEIIRIMKANGIEAKAMESGIRKMVDASNGTLTKEQVIQNVIEKASEKTPDIKHLIKDYHDGLLLYAATEQLAWNPAAKDVEGIEKFFKKNKKNYVWPQPRFKGFVLMAKKRVNLEKAVKLVKGCNSRTEAVEAIKKELGPNIMRNVLVRYGVFKEGDDVRVDYKKYGKEKPKPSIAMPYYDLVGTMIKAPQQYTDDKNQVVSDYQDLRLKEWVKSLRKQYSYTVNKKVLETVNNH